MSRNAVRERKKPKGTVRLGHQSPVQVAEALVRQEQELYGRPQPVPKLTPRTNNQKRALIYLEEGRRVVLLTGSAGTGKSMLAAYQAARKLRNKSIEKVYLVRPAVSVGKSVGMLPGDIKEKLTPYFKQTMAHLEKFLGKGGMAYALNKDQIEMQPVEYLRGMSFENCLVICEECQNFTESEMEMMLTRLGENAFMIFTGDQKQNDLKGQSGLMETVKLIDHANTTHPAYLDADDIEHLSEGIGVVQFTPDDVIRSGLTKAFVKLFHFNG